MKIAAQLIYTQDWVDIAKVVAPNLVRYCKRHNYVVSVKCVSSPFDAFQKIEFIRDLFAAGIDIAISFDCDALVTNHNYKIEEIIDFEHSFYVSKDVNGINCGVFILRNTPWAAKFIDYLLSLRFVVNCEQDAVVKYVTEFPNDPQIGILPQSVINAYKYGLYPEFGTQTEENGEFVEGKSFVLHLPGCSQEKRLEILKNTPIKM